MGTVGVSLLGTLGDGEGGALLLGTLDLVKFFVVRHGQVGEPG